MIPADPHPTPPAPLTMKTNNSSHRTGGGLPLLAAALLGLAGADAATPRLALRIATSTDGSESIPGESASAGHEGWINAIAFGQGFRQVPGTSLGSLGDFSFVKELDKATPKLQEACCKGTNFPSVTIHWLDEMANTPTGGVTVELRDVSVIRCRLGNGSLDPFLTDAADGGVPTEEVTLAYSEVIWHYNRPGAGGSVAESEFAHDTEMGTLDPASDDDRDGLHNAIDEDDDNDQVPDRYEVAHQLDPFDDDADLDNDHDKRSNRDEFIANTGANDPSSFFGIDSLRFARTSDGVEGHVSFPVAGGRSYRLMASPDLRLPRDQWFTIDAFDLPADSPEVAADVILSPAMLNNAGKLFFEVEIRMTPPSP